MNELKILLATMIVLAACLPGTHSPQLPMTPRSADSNRLDSDRLLVSFRCLAQ